MNLSLLFGQITLMFALMLVGILSNKVKFMHPQTANDLTNVLLYIVSPCLIIKSFEQPYSTQRARALGLLTVGIFLVYLVQIVISRLLFRKIKDANLRRIVEYGSIYSNAGFIGIPLVSSLFGSQGVFYAVVPLAMFNIFNWTHGVRLFASGVQQNRWQQVQNVVLNPNIIALAVGLVIFIFSLQLPALLNQMINYISAINTPVSMLVIGNSLANIALRNFKINVPISVSLFLRNLFYPLVTIVIMKLLGISGTPLMTAILMMACPVGGMVVLFTLQNHGKQEPALALMGTSTVLSLVTIPLVFLFSNFLF
ncbi:malate permease [Ligilactobacillus salitolerans]|uniref:Malate permease n=1 Tax=Ligilactobacillus salitolerans TaxID=1808352 RepID=A0A401IQV0_9LACO|nr:AEC family transporter [Ligilactobacillus salitolerans]GBG93893.1 malate permease [Ligilactobacillus salitolerans]